VQLLEHLGHARVGIALLAHPFLAQLQGACQLLQHARQVLVLAGEHRQRDLLVGAPGVVDRLRHAPHHRLERLLERVAAVAGGAHQRPVHVPEHQQH
jgi:hypothetical protein